MKIKVTVNTGWAGCDHINYEDLPSDWESLTSKEKGNYLHESAQIMLNEHCQAYAEVVDDEE
jgi:hypothetical protein